MQEFSLLGFRYDYYRENDHCYGCLAYSCRSQPKIWLGFSWRTKTPQH
ncbi:hypothetical protein AM1_F0177 (plasmid) [Acaryochloris marina MBIC11017]|uniref:Uncharacterized protein n=1 Tax=Acaryochloris marina (strain MBIC 11017) TaxID=329726 RepID=A8ZPX0_ACAM1|nr:hypothetical protein AM1_F0177 [Acaryochloris marina MBIC11017]